MTKILIIDDDPLLSKMYRDKFVEDGFTVEHAGNGEAGLAKVEGFSPDLIVLDMMMPKMDGLATLKRLKGDEATKDILVVMLTNVDPSHEEYKEGMKYADAYIVKSDKPPEGIVTEVKKVLESKK